MKKKINLCIIGPGKHYQKNIKPALLLTKKFKIIKELRVKFDNHKNKNIRLNHELNNKIDAVYISTPSHTHHLFILEALKCGKHVIVEKPFITNSLFLNRIIKLSQQKRLFVFEAFMYRFHPMFIYLKKILNSKKIGKIKYAIAYFNIPSIYPNHRYLDLNEQGFYYDTAVYPLSLINFLFNWKLKNIKLISSSRVKKNQTDLRGGIVLKKLNKLFYIFWGESLKYKNNLEIVLDKGSIYTEKIFTKLDNEKTNITLFKKKEKKIVFNENNQFKLMFIYIYNSIVNDKNFEKERENIVFNQNIFAKFKK